MKDKKMKIVAGVLTIAVLTLLIVAGPAEAFITKTPIATYLKLRGGTDMVAGNVKIEPLILLNHFPSNQELNA